MSAEAKIVQLKLKINGEEAFNSLRDLNEHISALRRKIDRMSKDEPGYQPTISRLRECLEKQKAWRNEIYGTKQAAKTFSEDFKSNLTGIVSAFSIGTLAINGLQRAFSGITSFFAGAQASWKAGEQTQAQLAKAIETTGSAAGRTREQLNALSSELMAQTGINSDDIAKAEALLLTFTNIRTDIYDKTLPIMLDMNKALGQSLQSSAIQLGKALNDPIRGFSALAEVGVSFNTQQREIITNFQKSGDLASAQKVILDELSNEFGGVAKAMAETNSGQLEAFDTRIVKIQENIGGMITALKAANLSVFEPFVRLLEKITTSKASEKLREEQTELNTLVRALMISNQNQTVRNRLIEELRTKYPDFLGKLKAEEITNEKLASRLKMVNEQYKEKIQLQINEERLAELQKQKIDLIREEMEARLRLAKSLNISEAEAAKLTEKQIGHLAKKRSEVELLKTALKVPLTGFLAAPLEAINYLRGQGGARALKDMEVLQNNNKKLTKLVQQEREILDSSAVIERRMPKTAEPLQDKGTKATPTTTELKHSLGSVSDQKKILQDFAKLGEEYQKLKLEQFHASLASNEKEIQLEKEKYGTLIAERQKFLADHQPNVEQLKTIEAQIDDLKSRSEASVAAIGIRQEKTRLEQIQALRDQFAEVHQSQLEKERALIKKHYAKLREEAKGNTAACQLLEKSEAIDLANAKIREEQRFQEETKKLREEAMLANANQSDRELVAIQKKYDDQVAALKEKFSAEFQATVEFHQLMDELDAQRAAEQMSVAEKAKEEKDKLTLSQACQMAQEVSNATFSIMTSNRQAETNFIIDEINRQRQAELENKDLTEEQKKAINDKYDKKVRAEKLRAWEADKQAAQAQAVINGALAFIIALKQGPWFAAATAIAAAAQIAVITAQQAPKFARGGFVPMGASHAAGGIALINPSGQKVGEIEGGEPILSRETYRNNREIIDTLLYSSQRLNGSKVVLNTAEIMRADRIYRTGGLAASNHQNTVFAADFSVLIEEVRQLQEAVREEKKRPVEFNYRVFEEVHEQVKKIRMES